VYHGKVAGLAPGTGAAFALLPAQNATGNWIKVVQRLPVRIALDPKELAAQPLRIGLSMQVKVDIARAEGTSLTTAAVARTEPAYKTTVFDAEGKEADALVARIIADNSGNGSAPARQ
jgi:membrane fusion protein (multidrug efflux system)